jgi:hypothetical protein
VEQASSLLVAGDFGPGVGLTQTFGPQNRTEVYPTLVQGESSLLGAIEDDFFQNFDFEPRLYLNDCTELGFAILLREEKN